MRWVFQCFDTDGEVANHRKVAGRLSAYKRYSRHLSANGAQKPDVDRAARLRHQYLL